MTAPISLAKTVLGTVTDAAATDAAGAAVKAANTVADVAAGTATKLEDDAFETVAKTASGPELTNFADGAVNLSDFTLPPELRQSLVTQWGGETVISQEMAAVKANHPELANIDDVALKALRDYTGSAYYSWNQALRANNPAGLTGFETEIKAAASALDDLPGYTGTVSRGTSMPKAEADKLQAGTIDEDPAFRSTSTDTGTAQNFGYNYGSDTVAVHYTIEDKGTGKSVEDLSQVPSEHEVLFAPQRYLITERNVEPNGTVDLHELTLPTGE